MAFESDSCRFCGTPRASQAATVCESCGHSYAATAPPVEGSSGLAASPPTAPPAGSTAMASSAPPAPAEQPGPAARVGGPAAVAAVPRAYPRRPVLVSWRDFASVVRIAVYGVVGWVVMAVLLGLTFGQAVDRGLGAGLDLPATPGFDPVQVASLTAILGSLAAGLGYRSVSAGAVASISLVPFGSLFVAATLAAVGARRTMRRVPPSGIVDLAVRISLAAAIGGLLIFLISALAILVYANNQPAPAGPFAPETLVTVLSAGPLVAGLLFVLLPALWLGVAAGVFSLPPARGLLRSTVGRSMSGRSARLLALAGPLAVGLAAYLLGLVVLSAAFVVAAPTWLVAQGADTTAVALGLPALLALAPNGIALLGVAATGVPLAFSTAIGSSDPVSLWQSDPWLIGGGLVALLGPPLVAGFVLRARRPDAAPGHVLGLGLLLAVVALVAANVAAPTIVDAALVAPTPAAAGSVAGGVHRLVFDLGEAAIVGGGWTVVATLAGFVLAMPFVRPSRRTAAAVIPAV